MIKSLKLWLLEVLIISQSQTLMFLDIHLGELRDVWLQWHEQIKLS